MLNLLYFTGKLLHVKLIEISGVRRLPFPLSPHLTMRLIQVELKKAEFILI